MPEEVARSRLREILRAELGRVVLQELRGCLAEGDQKAVEDLEALARRSVAVWDELTLQEATPDDDGLMALKEGIGPLETAHQRLAELAGDELHGAMQSGPHSGMHKEKEMRQAESSAAAQVSGNMLQSPATRARRCRNRAGPPQATHARTLPVDAGPRRPRLPGSPRLPGHPSASAKDGPGSLASPSRAPPPAQKTSPRAAPPLQANAQGIRRPLAETDGLYLINASRRVVGGGEGGVMYWLAGE
mmetsp:Transcript_63278/g.137662  ORF Transcript_63278/g.137662 Transcript_63278/m.137662 type:complete len:246 (-) Transcript_63278:41-778(-)